MKIKSLHIRNIASIVEADIDFEHDLNDRLTGRPSGIFLISGDTGAGKSALLDALSMALYKNTPRLVDVANKKNNSFRSGMDDEVNVNSIEQYTRLGISSKDDCYSEVVFEGVDGVEYAARLSLGLVRGEKNYRSVKWEYRQDGGDWMRVDAKSGQPLLQAAGLTFEQFGRMAMLAQGQFASFLTGDKKERESILEQLTNTESFTVYGKAIRELAKMRKADFEAARQAYELECSHLLTEQQVGELTRRQSLLEADIRQVKTEMAAEDLRLQRVTLILSEERKRDEALRRQALLQDEQAGETHRGRLQLVADWTATEQERGRYVQLLAAREGRDKARAEAVRLEAHFRVLLADLAARRSALQGRRESLRTEAAWLHGREGKRALYEAQGALCVSLQQYRQDAAKLERARQLLAGEAAKTQPLRERVAETGEESRKAHEALEAKQKEVDAGRRAVDELHPADTARRLQELHSRLTALRLMLARADELQQAMAQYEDECREGKKDAARLALLEKDMEQKRRSYEQARALAEAAARRLTTLGASLDTQLSQLRERLLEDHGTVCPLCGQPLRHELLQRETFERLLEPLKQEQAATTAASLQAELLYNKVRSDCNTLDGSLKARRSGVEKLQARIRQSRAELHAGLVQRGIAVGEADTPAQWTGVLRAEDEAGQRQAVLLQRRQEAASERQARLNLLVEAKDRLLQTVHAADQALTLARQALTRNQEDLLRLKAEAERMGAEQDALQAHLHTALSAYDPRWQEDPSATARRLAEEAADYQARLKAYTEQESALDRERILMDGLRGQAAEVAAMVSSPEEESSPEVAGKLYPCEDIRMEWSQLLGAFHRTRTAEEGYRTTMDECAAVLAGYYRRSGRDEAQLVALMQRGGEIAAARQEIARLEQDLKSCHDAVRTSGERILQEMEALGAGAREDVPGAEALQQARKELADRLEALNRQQGSVVASLTSHQQNVAKARAAEQAFKDKEAVHQRWQLLDKYFGDTRLRTLVQTYVLRPLLHNANLYLEQITDRYRLTCSSDNEQLSILVHDQYNKGQLRSATILSGGERFMISLALSLALSSLNRPDLNVNILFIDEGFGTLDEKSLHSVMSTLEKLQEIAGQSHRRVGIISHREELAERIPVQIKVRKRGEGRSFIEMTDGE